MQSVQPSAWASVQHSSKWGQLEQDGYVGLCRESLTDSDRDVRDWFVSEAKTLGCEVKVDEMGNIFAILQGQNNTIAPIGMGSHLDTQPAGGRFDGVLGVVAALEVLRTIKHSKIKTYAPLAAIDWTNEEGSRFPKMCTGSGVWSEAELISEAHDLADLSDSSVTMASELRRINYLGTTPCSYQKNPLSAHFELHIEQGSKLEQQGQKLAVVKGVQGMRWYQIRCKGREAHAGAMPMASRADALVALAKFAVKVEELSLRESAFGTVGVFKTGTSSPNTVPGSAFCTLDLRHSSEEVLDKIEGDLRSYLQKVESDREGLSIEMEQTWGKKGVEFDPVALRCVRDALKNVAGQSMVDEFESCAGHDSAETAKVTPTAMIFTPSKDGISHNPSELTSEEDCDLGAKALMQAVLLYDAHLRQQDEEISA
ncbi:hypothetical protein LT330_001749 [Penicillium expansum]|nr:hypothetical protein LT330_001749 [Penicillium expansum]